MARMTRRILRTRYLIPAVLGLAFSSVPVLAEEPNERIIWPSAPQADTIVGVVGQTIAITGVGFNAANNQVRIRFQPANLSEEWETWEVVAVTTATADGYFSTTFKVPIRPRAPEGYRVDACVGQNCSVHTTKDRDDAGVFVESSFTVTPASGVVGTTATARGTGFLQKRPLGIRFETVSSQGFDQFPQWTHVASGATDGGGSFTLTFRVPSRVPAVYDVVACHQCAFFDQSHPYGTDDFTVVAPRKQKQFLPRLTVDPIAPLGFVVQAHGEGFRPRAAVTLKWNKGLDREQGVVTADGAGRFGVYILILPRDFLGRRVLTATAVDHTPAKDDCLVVVGSFQPSDFAYRR